MGLFSGLGKLVGDVQKLLGKIGAFIDTIKEFFTRAINSVGNAVKLFDLVVGEVLAWKSFHESVPYRTGVINLPAAVEKTRALIDEIKSAWASVQDAISQVKKLAPKLLKQLAADVAESIASLEFPPLIILEWIPTIAIIVDVVEVLENLLDDLINIVQTMKDIREEIETGATVFLSQKNPRKSVKLADGGDIKIRVGSLHKNS